MRTLVYGGAASGKSEYAESVAVKYAVPRFYIATLIPRDEESVRRVERHHQMRRERGFSTIERYTGFESLVLPARGTVLLECLGNLAANELFEPTEKEGSAVERILRGIENLESQAEHLVVVTNDVFCDGGAYENGTLLYMNTLAALNAALAKRFETVVETVCGISIVVKGSGM